MAFWPPCLDQAPEVGLGFVTPSNKQQRFVTSCQTPHVVRQAQTHYHKYNGLGGSHSLVVGAPTPRTSRPRKALVASDQWPPYCSNRPFDPMPCARPVRPIFQGRWRGARKIRTGLMMLVRTSPHHATYHARVVPNVVKRSGLPYAAHQRCAGWLDVATPLESQCLP